MGLICWGYVMSMGDMYGNILNNKDLYSRFVSNIENTTNIFSIYSEIIASKENENISDKEYENVIIDAIRIGSRLWGVFLLEDIFNAYIQPIDTRYLCETKKEYALKYWTGKINREEEKEFDYANNSITRGKSWDEVSGRAILRKNKAAIIQLYYQIRYKLLDKYFKPDLDHLGLDIDYTKLQYDESVLRCDEGVSEDNPIYIKKLVSSEYNKYFLHNVCINKMIFFCDCKISELLGIDISKDECFSDKAKDIEDLLMDPKYYFKHYDRSYIESVLFDRIEYSDNLQNEKLYNTVDSDQEGSYDTEMSSDDDCYPPIPVHNKRLTFPLSYSRTAAMNNEDSLDISKKDSCDLCENDSCLIHL